MVMTSCSRRFTVGHFVELRLFKESITFYGFGERFATGAGELVVLSLRAWFGLGDTLFFPFGDEESGFLEAPECGVDSAAWHSGDINDVEAVEIAVGHRPKDDRRRVGEKSFAHSSPFPDLLWIASYLARILSSKDSI